MARFDPATLLHLATAAGALVNVAYALARRPATPLSAAWALFAVSIFFHSTGEIAGDRLGLVGPIVAVGGAATCGWAWLFARALFRPTPPFEARHIAVVAAITAPAAMAQIPAAFPPDGAAMRLAGNAMTLASSAALILIVAEALRGLQPSTPAPERRFRLAFAGVFATMIGLCAVWLGHDPAQGPSAAVKDLVRASCGAIAIVVVAFVARYRFRHPAPAARRAKPAIAPDAEARALAERIRRRLDTDDLFKSPTLRVADLADALGEPDYKISRCVTGAMGYANFNRLINERRLAHAKAALADPRFAERSILAIALDSGFGSIGPFNRAFKEATGQTPRAYRADAIGEASPPETTTAATAL
ncbi:MAG: helix-turn-helix transcriptional regulator [Parvularculaceae bacterium]